MHDQTNLKLLTERWQARWCRHPNPDLRCRSAAFLFRRRFDLPADAATITPFLVHVSADQRYRLSVNGVAVAWGPARGDTRHWRFETVDLAPYLRAGANVLSAVVHWFEPEIAPQAQITVEAAFLVQGNGEREAVVNTPGEWKVLRDEAYNFSTSDADALHTYCVVGPSERMDTRRHPWGWDAAEFDDSAWPVPVSIGRAAAPSGLSDSESTWWLIPRSIPAMEESAELFGRVVRVTGDASALVPDGWPGSGSLTVSPNTRVSLLLDHGVETCAFPEIVTSGGAGATLRLAYAEALFDADIEMAYENQKSNRNEIIGRKLIGYADSWTLDGGAERLLRPLWWKTYRYAELTIETADTPVTIDRLISVYTGYPFAERARFCAPEMEDAAALWEIGWRTTRLCAHETYMDCPYYEQLQYIGDTRIQCLVSLYASGDSGLFRNALTLLNDSRIPEGLTQSRYPARITQVIPPFSLWYIGMIGDYRRHVPGDTAFLQSLFPGVDGILSWFRDRLGENGLLGRLPFWNFVDWCEGWSGGVPPGAREGGSSVLTLQYALACQDAADLATLLLSDSANPERGRLDVRRATEVRNAWRNEAKAATTAVLRHCFDPRGARVADTPEKISFSQHAGILAVLADAVPRRYFRPILKRVLTDPSLTQATFYCRFYLTRALVKAGMGDQYLETLGPWRDMRAMGLTTWAEKPEPTRSDCHAWSAAPNYEFLATVLGVLPGSDETSDRYPGIFPASAGWDKIRIAPHLGALTHASGVVPHPDGEIAVAYRRDAERLIADITLPPAPGVATGVRGRLHWRGRSIALQAGSQTVTLG